MDNPILSNESDIKQSEISLSPDIKTESQPVAAPTEYIPFFQKREVLVSFCSALWLGILYNFANYGLSFGIMQSIFFLVAILTFNLVLHFRGHRFTSERIILSVLSVIFSSLLSFRVWSWLTFWNSIALLYSLLLLIGSTILPWLSHYKLFDFWPSLARIVPWFFDSFLKWLRDISHSKFPKLQGTKYIHIIKGILLALPIIIILASLLASADLVFSKYLWQIFSFNLTPDFFWRSFHIAFFSSILFAGYLYVFRWLHTKKEQKIIPPFVPKSDIQIEANIILWAISALFFLFMIIQIAYLFWWQGMISAEWFTYADYAKRWFFELAIAGCIVFFLIWILDGFLYWHEHTPTSRLFKSLSTILILLTLWLLASAFMRLKMYEITYGFTELRFYGYVFLILVAIEFIIMWVKQFLHITESYFIITSLWIFAATIIICNVINPESYISQNNLIKDYQGSVRMDSLYIGSFSEDAVDNIILAYKTSNSEDKNSLHDQLCNMRFRLDSQSWDWREFHYAKFHAKNSLSALNLGCVIRDN